MTNNVEDNLQAVDTPLKRKWEKVIPSITVIGNNLENTYCNNSHSDTFTTGTHSVSPSNAACFNNMVKTVYYSVPFLGVKLINNARK